MLKCIRILDPHLDSIGESGTNYKVENSIRLLKINILIGPNHNW